MFNLKDLVLILFVSSVQEYKLSADLNRIEPKKTYSGMCTIPYNVECNVECNVEWCLIDSRILFLESTESCFDH